MDFNKVQELYMALDANNDYDADDHVLMQVTAKANGQLYVVRLGEYGRQSYVYILSGDAEIPPYQQSLEGGIPFYGYDDGIFWAGHYYEDFPDKPKRYDPNSGELGSLPIPVNLDWTVSDKDYLIRIAKAHRDNAAYELNQAEKALDLLIGWLRGPEM